jgi:hypothetical protein
MTPAPARAAAWLPVAAAVLFAVAHTQSPGVYSNQNQYYLHGLADAGYGDLRTDWLANTADPTPLFSGLVSAGYRVGGLVPLHAAFFVLLIGYFLSLWWLAAALPFFPATFAGRTAFAAGLVVLHSAILRVDSVKFFGVDYPWYFQAGVANQYLVGPGLQPSVFGVLLLTALGAFAHGRPVLAGCLAAAACVFHSTYLLPAGLLVAGMIAALLVRGNRRAAVRTGAVALLGVLPVIGFILVRFAPSSPEEFAEAQRVIAWVRIPHHCDVGRWLDWVAAAQLAWIAAGVAAFRRTAVFPVLLVAVGGSVTLSLVQLATGNATLALLFPWRVSAVLVPVATAAAAAGLATLLEAKVPGRFLFVLSGLLATVGVVGSLLVVSQRLSYQQTTAEEQLIRAVAAVRSPGDVYLLPADFPKPPPARGSASSTAVPVKASDRPAIFEFQRFRIGTGAACYVDFKSIPYRDVEVLEWHRRVRQAAAWYAADDWDATGVVDQVTAAGVTHVVLPVDAPVRSRRFVPVCEGPVYRVVKIE